jgi:nucleotide-binding universal stress UspA family protein
VRVEHDASVRLVMIALQRIAVPRDFSAPSEAAHRCAVVLARTFDATLDVLQATRTHETGVARQFDFVQRTGTPSADIVRYATEHDIDLIVMGTQGVEKVVRSAPCPVLTVQRPQPGFRVTNILVPVDFGTLSQAAVTYGRALGRAFGARLHLLHVAENHFLRPAVADPHTILERAQQQLTDLVTSEDREMLDAVTVLDVSDSPAEAIVSYAAGADIDLIVMGTHGRQALDRLLAGSVAERVVRSAPCPVLTVRQHEREFVMADVPPDALRAHADS